MKIRQRSLAIASAGLFGWLLTTPADAQRMPLRPESTLTLTEQMEVPGGVILDPGSYIVRVADSQSAWNVVEITSVDRSKSYATCLTTPHTAKDSAPNTLFVFYKTPSGQPRVLRSWFPSDDRWGQDFVYSRARSEELARVGDTTTTTSVADITYTSNLPPPAETVAESVAETPMPAETVAEQTTVQRTELPRTASDEPLLALVGLTALGAGFAVRRSTA